MIEMVVKLIKRNGNYYCNNCQIKQPNPPSAYCWFCGFIFSNFEEELIDKFREDFDNEIDG